MGNRRNTGQRRKARKVRKLGGVAAQQRRAAEARPAHRPRSKATGAFAKWLDGCGMTVAQVATKIGVTPAVVYNYRVGRFKPGREASAKIEEISDGAVPVSSWDAPRKAARASAA